MAVAEQKQGTQDTASQAGNVRSLNDYAKGESLWLDAWKRLRRNKPALMGLVVIIFWILVAIFAPAITTRAYDLQDTDGQQRCARTG